MKRAKKLSLDESVRRCEIPLDERVRGLCGALNSLRAVATFSSCGGHANPQWPAQEPEGHFYICFEVEQGAAGWRSLALIAYAALVCDATVVAEYRGGKEYRKRQYLWSRRRRPREKELEFAVKGRVATVKLWGHEMDQCEAIALVIRDITKNWKKVFMPESVNQRKPTVSKAVTPGSNPGSGAILCQQDDRAWEPDEIVLVAYERIGDSVELFRPVGVIRARDGGVVRSHIKES